MPSTAQALRRAHRRGVRVQVVVDDRSAQWGSVRALRRELGTSTRRHSFVRVCDHSCRGTTGNQHAKFVTISRSGRAEDVVMVGSMNFTAYAAARQWQDLYVVRDDRRLFRQLRTVFRAMLRDEPQAPLALPSAGRGLRTDVAPSRGTDRLVRRLSPGALPRGRARHRLARSHRAAGLDARVERRRAAWSWPAGSPSCAPRAATCGCSRGSASAGRSARS